MTQDREDRPTVPLNPKAVPKRQDRWTPKSSSRSADGGDTTAPATAETSNSRPDGVPELQLGDRQFSMEELVRIDKIQNKIQQQLKTRRTFKVDESAGHTHLDKKSFQRTLSRYGVDLDDDERDTLFDYYDKDGGGELDHAEFIQGIRGSEFVQTARSYGFETPDPLYHDEDPERGLGHFVDLAGMERESALKVGTARCAKAWQQQRAVDGCPFGTDRRMFGGAWQYRTSTLIKAEPVVAPKFGKTGFPARKELNDILTVIAEKLNERSKGSLAFTRMFNQFDSDKNGSIDRAEFDKLLDIFNISLTDQETEVVFEHFGAEDGGIRYKPFVHTVEMQNRKHPLGGLAGSGFGTKRDPSQL